MRLTALTAATAAIVVSLSACDDGGKASEQTAVDEIAKLTTVIKEDVAQVRRGLPQGAAKLGPMLDADTLGNPGALQKAIGRARAEVQDLAVSKGTFFSYADATGTVVRSEADPDMLAGKSIVGTFPALKKALDPASGVVETFGQMKELVMAKTGPDMAWVTAMPVKDDKGGLKGAFLTGWSFRAYVYRLEQSAKMSVTSVAEKAGKKHAPLVYIYVVKGKTAYGAPGTPDVNAKKAEELDLLGKTSAGPYRGQAEITGRVFGIAAQRLPEMGDDAVLTVLASHI